MFTDSRSPGMQLLQMIRNKTEREKIKRMFGGRTIYISKNGCHVDYAEVMAYRQKHTANITASKFNITPRRVYQIQTIHV